MTGKVLVLASPQDVWERLVRWEEQPRWMADASRVRVVGDRREGTGVRLSVRTKVFGLIPLLNDELEVTEWRPGRLLVVERRGWVGGRGEWRIRRFGAGTRFTWRERLSMPLPVLGELMLWLYRPVMKRLMRRSLNRFAALAAQDRAAR